LVPTDLGLGLSSLRRTASEFRDHALRCAQDAGIDPHLVVIEVPGNQPGFTSAVHGGRDMPPVERQHLPPPPGWRVVGAAAALDGWDEPF
jgi:hypothetical protein